MLKNTFFLLLFVLFINLTAFSQAKSTWKKFSSSEGKFSVLMPSEPTTEARKADSALGKLTIHLFNAESALGIFFVSYTDYPDGPDYAAQRENVLDGVQKGIAESLGVAPFAEAEIEMGGSPGREIKFRVKSGNLNSVIIYRITLVDNRLYQIASGTLSGNSNAAEIEKFFSSFALNP